MSRTTSIAIVLISLMATIPAQTQAKDTTDIDAVKQVEQSMGEAMIAGDVDKLNQIYADDFAAIGFSGTVITKQNFLSDHDKLEWFENGPIDVQVFGDLALAQGFVKEKRNRNGKDISVQSFWQDVLRKRAGKWVVWRTTGARVDLVGSHRLQSQDPAVVDAVKQFEQNVGDLMIAGDVDKLNQIYADDFAAIGSSGTVITKENFLSDHDNLVSFENGPINVQVFGDVAVVQTSVTEKRIQGGKDTSGQFAFMDLLKKRAGKWVIVRTLAARVS